MGSNQSSEKLHCNRYLHGQGPPSLTQQANGTGNGISSKHQGFQPEGQMTLDVLHRGLPGSPLDNTIQISFTFPDGIQTEHHPHPGQSYSGLQLHVYLPDNHEGRKILKQLDKAFYQKLLFTVLTDVGGRDVVASSIALKTQSDGGKGLDCYPDSDDMERVRKRLKEKGVE